MSKIVILCKHTGANFIRHYYPHMPDTFPILTHTRHGLQDAMEAVRGIKPYIVIFEWADNLTASIINDPTFQALKLAQPFKTVVRLHDHEITKKFDFGLLVDRIDWEQVDAVWFVNRNIEKMFKTKFPGVKTFYLPNAVDPAGIEEHLSEEKRAGLLSLHFRHRKRIDRVVHLAALLPDWTFHVRADIPQVQGGEFYKEFLRVLALAVDAFGQPEKRGLDLVWPNLVFEHRDASLLPATAYEESDLNEWFKNKSVILSTSDHEGFHYAVGQGMAAGCFPVVWPWPTAREFWGPFVVDGVEAAADRISNYPPSHRWRLYVKHWYGPDALVPMLIEKLEGV